jgi:GNAT superfamily N-acetyltransferase
MVLIAIGWRSLRGGLLAVAECCFVRGRRAMILNVYTEPEFRRLGVARRIMQTILDWIRARGLRSANLHASHEGRVLYEKLGFVATNEMRLRFDETR